MVAVQVFGFEIMVRLQEGPENARLSEFSSLMCFSRGQTVVVVGRWGTLPRDEKHIAERLAWLDFVFLGFQRRSSVLAREAVTV
jgi:hypothetical protein